MEPPEVESKCIKTKVVLRVTVNVVSLPGTPSSEGELALVVREAVEKALEGFTDARLGGVSVPKVEFARGEDITE